MFTVAPTAKPNQTEPSRTEPSERAGGVGDAAARVRKPAKTAQTDGDFRQSSGSEERKNTTLSI